MKGAEPGWGITPPSLGSQRLMNAWRIAACLSAMALAAGCSIGPAAPPHTVAVMRDGRGSADLDVVSGATSVTVGTASLGGELLRVSTPVRSGIRPHLVTRGRVSLYLVHTGGRGPAAVRILLDRGVTWRLDFTGGTSMTTVDLGRGRVSRVDFAAGSSAITVTLPRPTGTAAVVLAGGASRARLSLPAGVPARLRLDGGAGYATIAGKTYTGVAGGTVFAAPGWAQARGRYDIEAPAGVSTISVTG
jgi:hypothetical protein